jgi:hypothetical protein
MWLFIYILNNNYVFKIHDKSDKFSIPFALFYIAFFFNALNMKFIHILLKCIWFQIRHGIEFQFQFNLRIWIEFDSILILLWELFHPSSSAYPNLLSTHPYSHCPNSSTHMFCLGFYSLDWHVPTWNFAYLVLLKSYKIVPIIRLTKLNQFKLYSMPFNFHLNGAELQ